MPDPATANGPPPVRRISVIVPTLNEQTCLAATLDAVVLSPGDELIVVDGGSKDGTRLVQALRRRGRLTILPQAAALDACLARSIADVSSAPARTIVPSESVAGELHRFLRTSCRYR